MSTIENIRSHLRQAESTVRRALPELGHNDLLAVAAEAEPLFRVLSDAIHAAMTPPAPPPAPATEPDPVVTVTAETTVPETPPPPAPAPATDAPAGSPELAKFGAKEPQEG